MAIDSSDIEKAALIKSHTSDGETTVARDAEDMAKAISLANSAAANTPTKKQNVLANIYNYQLQKTE